MVPILFIRPNLVTAACSPGLPSFGLVVNGLYSTQKPVRSGLLEGPVLFDICINNLEVASECTLIRLADDTKLGGNNQHCQGHDHHSEGLRLQGQANRNLQRFSTNKCKVLHPGSKCPLQQYRLGLISCGAALGSWWAMSWQWPSALAAEKANSLPYQARAWPADQRKWLLPLLCTSIDCISNTASSSGLLRQEKYQTRLSPGEGHQDGWELEHLPCEARLRDWERVRA